MTASFKYAITLFIAFSFAFVSHAQGYAVALDTSHVMREGVQARKAMAVAGDFVNGMIRGVSADSLASFCAVPFCKDDSTVIVTSRELRAFFGEMLPEFAESSKKNNPRVDSVFIYGVEKGVVTGLIPVNTYLAVVRIKFSIKGQEPINQFIVAVQMSDSGKVIGISN